MGTITENYMIIILFEKIIMKKECHYCHHLKHHHHQRHHHPVGRSILYANWTICLIISSLNVLSAPALDDLCIWMALLSCMCTLVMGRTLDLPSVIELAPCKYKRVYFYFDVQKKLITNLQTIYICFFVCFFCNCPVDSSKY